MKIAICDDEIEYINDVEKHINQYCFEHGLTVEVFKYSNGKELIEQSIPFDIAFLLILKWKIWMALKSENACKTLIRI